MPAPNKILFLDEVQVEDTIQRYGGTLERKTPKKTKNISLKLQELGVSVEETDESRTLNRYEKLELLRHLLKKNDALALKRPADKHFDKEFVSEICRACRVIVPPDAVSSRKTPALAFWLSTGFETDGLLCLLEGDGSDRENPYNTAKCSNYTILQSLIHFARKQSKAGILGKIIPDNAHPNLYAKVNDTHPPSLVEQHHNVSEFTMDFYKDAEGLLKQWGCDVRKNINIETIYRVREFGPEDATRFSTVSTFAYALSIQICRNI